MMKIIIEKVKEHIDDKQAAVLPTETKEKAPFDENGLSEWMKRMDSGGLPQQESRTAVLFLCWNNCKRC